MRSSYIDNLLDEIHRLRLAVGPTEGTQQAIPLTPDGARCSPPFREAFTNSVTAIPAAGVVTSSLGADNTGSPTPGEHTEDAVRNPLLDERPWFFPVTPDMPVLVGEATDVAFATKLRQEILGSPQPHFLRTQNVQDEAICSLWTSDCPWPTPSRARFLLKVSFNTACRRYYLVRKSATLQLLEQVIQDPTTCDLISTCKLHALFALGEAYSTRTCVTGDQFPGIRFYVSATKLLRVLSERSRIDCVEIIMMLSIYSLAMNRRHSAYCMAGYAVRFAIILGLHLDVPQHQLPNIELREHRNRVWWTAFILDRSWACMLGKPVSIQGEDIDAQLPSAASWSSLRAAEDFEDTEYFTASLRLADLGAKIAGSIYSRRMHRDSLSSRVQQALRDLGKWLQELPYPLRSAIDQATSTAAMPIITLYLFFNQCLMLASRPVLLYVLRHRKRSSEATSQDEHLPLSETALALSEACVQCARRSYRILTQCWISGSFPTFDYTYTQYLFSSSIVLAMSRLLQDTGSQDDGDDFETTAHILHQLDHAGNSAAKEFGKHMEATRSILDKSGLRRSQFGSDSQISTGPVGNDGIPPMAEDVRATIDTSTDDPGLAWAESSLQELLSQQDMSIQSLEPSIFHDGFEAFVWPEEGYGDLERNWNG